MFLVASRIMDQLFPVSIENASVTVGGVFHPYRILQYMHQAHLINFLLQALQTANGRKAHSADVEPLKPRFDLIWNQYGWSQLENTRKA